MMRAKSVFLLLTITMVFLIAGGIAWGGDVEQGRDSRRFQEEYESLNLALRKNSSTDFYRAVMINADNPIQYVTAAEVLEILEHETAFLYMGAPWCPWCRNIVPVMLEAAGEKGVDPIYYLDLTDERDVFHYENGKLSRSAEGTEDYFKLLRKLDAYLEPYVVRDKDGREHDTQEKRIPLPFLVAVKDGGVVMARLGTYELEDGQSQYDELTKDQRAELYTLFCNMYASLE